MYFYEVGRCRISPSFSFIREGAMRKYNLLLVDDDPFILEGIGEDLSSNGYQVTRANSGEKAVALLENSDFDLVITDLVMDDTDGIQVLKKTKELNADVKVIILTGFGDMISAIEALRHQADDYLLKPCESEEMIFRVKNCLEKSEMTRKINLFQKILPMCCVCKKIRDDTGKEPGSGVWITVEKFIHESARLDITSSYCPECAKKTMDEFIKKGR
jgi:YesN/AraC family two-component response regulator